MELHRKSRETIINWYKEDKNALLVRGARQVGKTHLIRSVLNELHCDWLEINLIEKPEAISVLESVKSVDDMIIGLSTISGHTLKKGETVLFIDEVQKYKDMVTKIKFLVDEGSFRYILSGSLLGIELTNLESAPVGYMNILDMYPLDFEEFLQISNIDEDTLSYLEQNFIDKTAVMDAVHDKMMEMFRRYLVVGGMPAAVSAFAETSDLNKVVEIHNNILSLYKMDFTQYEENEKKLLITQVYDLIPAELQKQNRRFIVTDLKKGLRFDRMENTFLWLEKSGVAIGTYNVSAPCLPLLINEKQSLFKLFLADVGLLTTIYGMHTKAMILQKDNKLNAGGIYENAIAQELKSKGYKTYYYNSNKNGELDFLIESNGHVLPLEIKSGKKYTIHSALNKSIECEEYDIQEGIVLADCNVSSNGRIQYLPIYMIMFMKNDTETINLDPIVF